MPENNDHRATSAMGEILNANISEATRGFEGIPKSLDLAGAPIPNDEPVYKMERNQRKKELRNEAVYDAMMDPEKMFFADYKGVDPEIIATLSNASVQFAENGVTELNGITINSEKKLHLFQLHILNDCMKQAGYPWSERPHFNILSKFMAAVVRTIKKVTNRKYATNSAKLLQQMDNVVYVKPDEYKRELRKKFDEKDDIQLGEQGLGKNDNELDAANPMMPTPPGIIAPASLGVNGQEVMPPIIGPFNGNGLDTESGSPDGDTKTETDEPQLPGDEDMNDGTGNKKDTVQEDLISENPQTEKRTDVVQEDQNKNSDERLAKRAKSYKFLLKKIQSEYDKHKDQYGDFQTARESIMIACISAEPKYMLSNIECLPRAELLNNKELAKFAIAAEMDHIKDDKFFKQYHPIEKYNIPKDAEGNLDKDSKEYARYEKYLLRAAIKRLPSASVHFIDTKDMRTAVDMIMASKETMPYMLPYIAEMNGNAPVLKPNGRITYKDEFIVAMADALGANIKDARNAEQMTKAAETRLKKLCNTEYKTFGYSKDELQNITDAETMAMHLVHELTDDTAAGVVNRALNRTSPVLLQIPQIKMYFSKEENYNSLMNAVKEFPELQNEFGDTYGWIEKRDYVMNLYNELTNERAQQIAVPEEIMTQALQALTPTEADLIDKASTERCNLDRDAGDYLQKESEIIKKLAKDIFGDVNQETYQKAKDLIYNEDAKDLDVEITDSIEEETQNEAVTASPSRPQSLGKKLQGIETSSKPNTSREQEEHTL